jgi:hypothetical protein
MSKDIKTRQVAEVLGTPAYQLMNLMVRNRIARPSKDCSGNYWWTPQEVEAARQALATPYARRQKQTA